MSFLLDTCVISELVAARPNDHVVRWIKRTDPSAIYLSVVTIGEIQRGIEGTPNLKRKEVLRKWLETDLLLSFQDKILNLDVSAFLVWGKLTSRLHRLGKPMPAIDSLIAATVIQHRLTLVTRNVDDFKHADIKILNPWIL